MLAAAVAAAAAVGPPVGVVAPALLVGIRRLAAASAAAALGHQMPCIMPAHPPQPQLPCINVECSDRAAQLLASYFPDRAASPPSCLTVMPDPHEGGPTGAAAKHLEAAGMRVTSLLLRRHVPHSHGGAASEHRCCLQVAAETEAAAGAAAAEAAAAAASPAPQHTGGSHQGAAPAIVADRPWNAADALCFADSMHLLDTRRALQAAHRHLRPKGLLLVQWTDLDLSSDFAQQLEDVLEEAVPGYIRYDCQHDPSVWAPRLQMGGLFRLIDFIAAPHSLALPPAALMDALDHRGPLRSSHGSSRRRSFHHRLQHLIDAHCSEVAAVAPGSASSQACQRHRILLPLHTKAYLLARSPSPPGGTAVAPSGQRSRGALEPERVCLFCGAPVAAD